MVRLRSLAVAALLVMSVPATAAPVGDRVTAALSHRLFPLLDTIGADPAAVERLKAQPGVAAMLADRAARRTACAQDLACLAQAMVWTAADGAPLVAAVPAHATRADDGAAAQAAREIEGINTILRSYALAQVPRYPAIDGAGTIDPLELRARVQAADWLARTPRAGSAQALDPSIDFALALLDVSDRTDAIGFEPITGGLNAAAAKRARGLDWLRWRYSALILTGVGPETPADHDYQGGFAAALMLKDLRLAMQAAEGAGATTPLGAHATALYEAFVAAGNGGTDFSGIIRTL